METDIMQEPDLQPVTAVTFDGQEKATNLSHPSFSIEDLDVSELKKLDKLKRGINYMPKYIEFEKEGQAMRVKYIGKFSMKVAGDGGNSTNLPSVLFVNSDGFWVHSGVSLVGTSSMLKPGTNVELEYLGEFKTGNKNNAVKKFNVFELK